MHSEDEVRQIVEDLQRRGLADAVYRALWFDHVIEDVESYMTEKRGYDGPPLTGDDKGIAVTIASRYVYEGDYDCNVSYWDQIDTLLDDVVRGKDNDLR